MILAVTFALWFGLLGLKKAYVRYQATFHAQARASLSEFFLFLGPTQLWVLNSIMCCSLMVIVYLLSGSFMACAMAGGAALILPHCLIVRLRNIRLARFRSDEHTSELQSLMRLSYAVFSLK